MTNAKEEFLDCVGKHKIAWAIIQCFKLEAFPLNRVVLKPGFSEEEFYDFIKHLDFEYWSGHGTQHLFGYIVLADGTWMERWEYDGAEGWEHKSCPRFQEVFELAEIH